MLGFDTLTYSMDTLICGSCKQAFHDLNQFVEHKNSGCQPPQLTTAKTEPNLELEDGEEMGLVVAEDSLIVGEEHSTVLMVPEGADVAQEGEVYSSYKSTPMA